MSSYVNLLQESEIQLRSMARDKKSLRMAILGAIVIVLLIAWFFLRNYLAVTAEARELTTRWKTLEPQYAKAKERDDVLRTAGNRLGELRGWEQSRYSIPDLMAQLAELIPLSMQIISLEHQAFLVGVEGESRMPAAGAAAPATPPVPQRRNSLLLRALFTGPDSEQKVLNFVESLKAASFGGELTNVKLLETAKAGQDSTVAVGTRFTVDLQFKPRSLEWKKSN